jgi:hypothetical protein
VSLPGHLQVAATFHFTVLSAVASFFRRSEVASVAWRDISRCRTKYVSVVLSKFLTTLINSKGLAPEGMAIVYCRKEKDLKKWS